MTNLPQRKFSLSTTIAMIVGIVIGSGIFFKTPEIIKYTNGNIGMGILAFIIAGFGIIFGSLSIANYAQNDDSAGGLVSYCELSWGKKLGFLAGWFQTIIYFPAITAIITWVAANYTLAFLGQRNLLTTGDFNILIWPLSIFYLIFFFVTNLFQTKYSGKFQELTTWIKLLALLFLACAGFLLGNPTPLIDTANNFPTTSTGFLSALIAVSFTTDGWMLAPSIAHEIKDPKKNLTKALVIGPLIIIGIYLFYFYGVSSSVGPAAILSGVDPITHIATQVFGSFGPTLLFLLVLISIFGALNGLILTYIRTPYSLAIRNSLPKSDFLKKIHPKYDTPINAGIVCFILSLIYLGFHFLSLDGAIVYGFDLFNGLEIDSLPIVANYFFLICMYLGILFKSKQFKTHSFIKQKVFPILAIIGALFILYGGISKPQFSVYLILCFLLIFSGLLIQPKKHG